MSIRSNVNFTGTGVTVSDDGADDLTNVIIPQTTQLFNVLLSDPFSISTTGSGSFNIINDGVSSLMVDVTQTSAAEPTDTWLVTLSFDAMNGGDMDLVSASFGISYQIDDVYGQITPLTGGIFPGDNNLWFLFTASQGPSSYMFQSTITGLETAGFGLGSVDLFFMGMVQVVTGTIEISRANLSVNKFFDAATA